MNGLMETMENGILKSSKKYNNFDAPGRFNAGNREKVPDCAEMHAQNRGRKGSREPPPCRGYWGRTGTETAAVSGAAFGFAAGIGADVLLPGLYVSFRGEEGRE